MLCNGCDRSRPSSCWPARDSSRPSSCWPMQIDLEAPSNWRQQVGLAAFCLCVSQRHLYVLTAIASLNFVVWSLSLHHYIDHDFHRKHLGWAIGAVVYNLTPVLFFWTIFALFGRLEAYQRYYNDHVRVQRRSRRELVQQEV